MKNIKDMRQKIIDFVKSCGGQADRCKIKKHLGIEPIAYSGQFDRAVKTKKLTPVYGTGEISPGLFLSRKPIIAYKLAA